MSDRAFAGARARDHRHDAGVAQIGPEPVGVVTLVGHETPDAAWGGRQHRRSGPHVTGIAWRQVDDSRAAEGVGQDMDLGGRPAPRGADRLVFRPPLPPWAQRCAFV